MNNYTKVSDKMVNKYGVNVAFVYAKLCFKMRLSHRNKDRYFDNGFFEFYQIKDLMRDCNLGRNSIINILGKLEDAHLILRVHTSYASKIYLPKFDNHSSQSENKTSQSHKIKLSKEQKSNNKLNNNYVSRYSCSSVNKASQNNKKQYLNIGKIIDRFGKPLFNYALHIYHIYVESGKHIHNSIHFIYGILRRWQRKGIKTVNDAMWSEHDSHAKLNDNGPAIPIFKI